MNYYEILNLDRNCNIDDIKKSYKRLAMKWHPDRNPDNKSISEEKFKKISEAYNILSNPNLKKKYDNQDVLSPDMFNDINDPFDLFNSFFNNNNDFFESGFNNSFFKNNLQNHINMNHFFETSPKTAFSNFSSKKESTQIINGKSIKETIIENNNEKIQIQETNGKITKKIITKGDKTDIYYYDENGKFIKDN